MFLTKPDQKNQDQVSTTEYPKIPDFIKFNLNLGREARDLITVRYLNYNAQIPITIAHPRQPQLIDPGNGKLEDMVTICIKTFDRYPCLHRLIQEKFLRYF